MDKLTHEANNEQFAQKQEEICHLVQNSHPEWLKQINYALQKKETINQIKH